MRDDEHARAFERLERRRRTCQRAPNGLGDGLVGRTAELDSRPFAIADKFHSAIALGVGKFSF